MVKNPKITEKSLIFFPIFIIAQVHMLTKANYNARRHVKPCHLHQNMQTNGDQQDFARWLLDIGNGALQEYVKVLDEYIV